MFGFDSCDRDINLSVLDLGRIECDLRVPWVDAHAGGNVDFPPVRRADQCFSAELTALQRNRLMRAQRLNGLNHSVIGMDEQNFGSFDLDADHARRTRHRAGCWIGRSVLAEIAQACAETDSKSGGPDYLYLFTQAKSIAEKIG